MIAAPFLGEFGWEVAMWAPYLRYVARQQPEKGLTVCCRPGHEALYQDFAQPVPIPNIPKTYPDCWRAYSDPKRTNQIDPRPFVAKLIETDPANHARTDVEVIAPQDIPYRLNAHGVPELKHYAHHLLGTPPREPESTYIVIHARDSQNNRYRNWDSERWRALVWGLGELCPIVAIGHPEHSLAPINTEDYRGECLDEICAILHQAKLVIGPSSGPLTLANHCGTPAVWWSPEPKEVVRFGLDSPWNPQQVTNHQAHDSWNPPVQTVLHAVNHAMEALEEA